MLALIPRQRPLRHLATRGVLALTLTGGFTAFGPEARADDTYAVKAETPKLTAGQKGMLSLRIEGKNGWHINGEAPISLSFECPAHIDMAKHKWVRKDLAESSTDKARFAVEVSGKKAGTTVIPAEARFVVCQESACKPVKEQISFSLTIQPAK